MQTGVAAALEALAVAAFVSPDDLHVAFLHKEGAHGLVALPLAEHQIDVGLTARPEALHPQKAWRLSRQTDHLLQVFFISVYLVGVDLHPQVAQHAHRTSPPSQAVPLHKRPQLRKPRPQHPVWSLACAIDSVFLGRAAVLRRGWRSSRMEIFTIPRPALLLPPARARSP